ncbi:acetyl-CoA C-acyltransferase [Sphingomonas humi]|uniref:Acetyl-CoA C-acetyltransferase n=1 Tax=Sphingomonas humi TaxID=335630 RepID=A0ABP7RVE7_9SPHN
MTVLIFDAVRTPRGKARPDGGLASETPHGLVAHLVDALENRGNDPRRVDQLTLGCVGQVGAQGGHVGMVAKLASRLPDSTVTHTINNYCASGLSAIGQAAAAISAGQIDRALAGGVEMMSHVPFMADRANYYEATDFEPRLRYIPVALAADLLAEKEGITRAELDSAALRSQSLAAAAESNAAFQRSRIAAGSLDRDEAVRPTTSDRLAALPPAFESMAGAYAGPLEARTIDHRHTVAHAPPMADGAALALVGREGSGARARILGYAEAGGDPRDSLTAGFAALDKVLAATGLDLADVGRIEFMEAFAVVIARFLREGRIDESRVNVSGGHLAKGHPMGATGAILLSTLLDVLEAADETIGVVVATGAQGVGAAMVVERLA